MRKALIFACVILCSSFAGAQSTESVCDGEQGAAYGLCNAFCEAMECDTDDPQASETACNKVKSKFEQVTGHEPPCLAPQCVCIEALPGFATVASAPVISCSDNEGFFELTTEAGAVDTEARGLCGIEGTSRLDITIEEALACTDFLRGLAAAANVTCP